MSDLVIWPKSEMFIFIGLKILPDPHDFEQGHKGRYIIATSAGARMVMRGRRHEKLRQVYCVLMWPKTGRRINAREVELETVNVCIRV